MAPAHTGTRAADEGPRLPPCGAAKLAQGQRLPGLSCLGGVLGSASIANSSLHLHTNTATEIEHHPQQGASRRSQLIPLWILDWTDLTLRIRPQSIWLAVHSPARSPASAPRNNKQGEKKQGKQGKCEISRPPANRGKGLAEVVPRRRDTRTSSLPGRDMVMVRGKVNVISLVPAGTQKGGCVLFPKSGSGYILESLVGFGVRGIDQSDLRRVEVSDPRAKGGQSK
ncbi:hypothetical protein B0T17DRAFT_594286 [Bombardia bombarda]|uniref:Uncharacterized protein n=1 Tax=Bombardia bombarda TaxID=252184 RepID=A0AA39XI37_9PEZI|nr:hypothetical protein B0T17DRAFT_594286 [Bombardia bombarda]